MTALPPSPFLADSVVDPSPSNEGGYQGAPAVLQNPTTAGATDRLLAEIEGDYRFRLDVDRFMADIEEPPLFLRYASGGR